MTNPIQIQKFLGGVDYPADRDKLVETARSHGADDRVIKTLQQLPDRTYSGPNAVSKEISTS